jgi:hypothetical protein
VLDGLAALREITADPALARVADGGSPLSPSVTRRVIERFAVAPPGGAALGWSYSQSRRALPRRVDRSSTAARLHMLTSKWSAARMGRIQQVAD